MQNTGDELTSLPAPHHHCARGHEPTDRITNVSGDRSTGGGGKMVVVVEAVPITSAQEGTKTQPQ